MGEHIIKIYAVVSVLTITIIVIVRTILILRLYAIKDGKIFDKTAFGEMFSFLASFTLPFKIDEDPNNPKTLKIIRTLNTLKTIYWYLMLSILVFIILMNVLEHGFGMKFNE